MPNTGASSEVVWYVLKDRDPNFRAPLPPYVPTQWDWLLHEDETPAFVMSENQRRSRNTTVTGTFNISYDIKFKAEKVHF
jgi:hypothetical protein